MVTSSWSRSRYRFSTILSLGLGAVLSLSAETFDPDALEFFESRIRPILAQECYECHRAGQQPKGGLALDSRDGWQRGGDSGPAIEPGSPETSLLLSAIRGEADMPRMPKDRAPLEPHSIRDLETWIRQGAPDPRDRPATQEEISKDTDWAAVRDRRAQWWSFRPLEPTPTPAAVSDERDHVVDRFIDARLREVPLEPNGPAAPSALLRRLSFALRGLPPEPEATRAFSAAPSPQNYQQFVDLWLNSPSFGERWARRWMDWVRYAESHGSEGDPKIPYAWRYRDYLIRALNDDVPYHQLVLESVAGDLLKHPRINPELGLNESMIGASQLRFVYHGFAPTDALDELTRFTNDQIDTVSKAFLGLTIACARCHDHKFDAISQADFYSWFGIFASTRPGITQANTVTEKERATRQKLVQNKRAVRDALVADWKPGALFERFEAHLSAEVLEPLDTLPPTDWRAPALKLQREGAAAFLQSIREAAAWSLPERERQPWNLPITPEWTAFGSADFGRQERAGAFAIAPEGEQALLGIYPSGVYSHLHTSRDAAALQSPRRQLNEGLDLWALVAGDGGAVARYAVQNYPRDGTVYPAERLNGGHWRWKRFSLDYWRGDRIHFEVTTAADQPVLANTNADRSWFGVRDVRFLPSGTPNPPKQFSALARLAAPLMENAEADLHTTWIQALVSAASDALRAWSTDQITDRQAEALDELMRAGILDNRLESLPQAAPLIEVYRLLEQRLPQPIRVPGVLETTGFDQPLFERGDHTKPAEPVQRRFLEFLDATPYTTVDSGRLQLAHDLIRDDNPFTARVAVNRIWSYLFGQGIVATPDNFGRLGSPPSHPELLDYLAERFREDGWSIKSLIRLIVTSESWKADSVPSPRAQEIDPENRWFSHQNLRRLDAEALRDHLLATSGALRLDERFGPPVSGSTPRRSVYVSVIRNRLDPFLSVFNAPAPSATKGRRDNANVPEQALTLLNSPLVRDQATNWAEATQGLEEDSRIEQMWIRAFGREITQRELAASRNYVGERRAETARAQTAREAAGRRHAQAQARLQSLETRARERVLSQRETTQPRDPETPLLKPLVSWDFTQSLIDEMISLPVQIVGSAQQTPEGLALRGGHARSQPLPEDIGAKSLEVHLTMSDWDQRGGGVLSLQTLDGGIFDAIVFGEQAARHWIAGSNFFERTQDFMGPTEADGPQRALHLVWVYAPDGTILAYRNGMPYGRPYRASGLQTFRAQSAQLLVGNRHGEPNGDRLFRGVVHQARLYPNALRPDEVEALFHHAPDRISPEALVAALTDSERAQWDRWTRRAEEAATQQQRLTSQPGFSDPWADFAHALFNMKEFIYLP